VQKYYLFPIPQALFSTIFTLFYISLDFNEKKFALFSFFYKIQS